MKRSGTRVAIAAIAVVWWSMMPGAQARIVAPEEPEQTITTEQPVATSQETTATAAQDTVATTEESAATEAQASEVAEEPIVDTIEVPDYTKFLDIHDALPGRFFDAAATAPDPADPNRLVIALPTGSDPTTWKTNNFRASTAAFNHLAAVDTISFRIEAPKGQRIARIIYTQHGIGSAIRVARASGTTQWVVDGRAAQLGLFTTNPSLAGEAVFPEPPASVDVSITTGLFVFAAPTSGSASLEVTSADVQVELVPASN
jgi:hypothetical protein